MDKLVIEGGKRLKGTVKVSGAKNSVLPILAATLLTDEPCVIDNVPQLRDTLTMVRILRTLGAKVLVEGTKINVEPSGYKGNTAPWKLVSTMRASICLLGPLLAKKGYAEVSMPGGCIIGPRPIDLHIKGIRSLGANIKIEHGYIIATAKRLRGNNVYLGGAFGSSVLATANVMMAATLAKGRTTIENAACEPELADLAKFLTAMGAKIYGVTSPVIEIEGVKKLKGAHHRIIPDRIEAGTYLVAGAITGGDVVVEGAVPSHLGAIIDKLKEAGVNVAASDGKVHIKSTRHIKPLEVTTLPYPGFPTDMQAQIMALMSVADGISIITEKIYPDRFMHISEMNRMGAQIMLEGSSAIVKGVPRLSGAHVMASDLRASAALVLTGLVAKGRTEIHRVYHLDRGYEKIEEKFSRLGARIWREKDDT